MVLKVVKVRIPMSSVGNNPRASFLSENSFHRNEPDTGPGDLYVFYIQMNEGNYNNTVIGLQVKFFAMIYHVQEVTGNRSLNSYCLKRVFC